MADDKPVSRVRINLGNRDKPTEEPKPQSRVRINLTGRK